MLLIATNLSVMKSWNYGNPMRVLMTSRLIYCLRFLLCWLLTFSISTASAEDIHIPEMVLIPGGCFEMGTLLMNSQGNVPRNTCVDSFYMGVFEVTEAQFRRFQPRHPGAATELPATGISWFDAATYANWLSDNTGQRYRLPTEDEWEYAARAGSGFGFQFSWGNYLGINNANCRDCGSAWDGRSPAPVGSFPSNAFGLHDMHGNVAEWTTGCYHGQDEVVERFVNGHRLRNCRVGVLRGGSWNSGGHRVPFWVRSAQDSTTASSSIGFRLVMEAPNNE